MRLKLHSLEVNLTQLLIYPFEIQSMVGYRDKRRLYDYICMLFHHEHPHRSPIARSIVSSAETESMVDVLRTR